MTRKLLSEKDSIRLADLARYTRKKKPKNRDRRAVKRTEWATFLTIVEEEKSFNFAKICRDLDCTWEEMRWSLMNLANAKRACAETISLLKGHYYEKMEKGEMNTPLAKEMIRVLTSGELFKPDDLPFDEKGPDKSKAHKQEGKDDPKTKDPKPEPPKVDRLRFGL